MAALGSSRTAGEFEGPAAWALGRLLGDLVQALFEEDCD